MVSVSSIGTNAFDSDGSLTCVLASSSAIDQIKSTCTSSPCPPLGGCLSYHGGSVMTGTVNLYNVYYGDFSSTPSTRELVDYFSAHIGNTSWAAMFPSSFYQYQNGIYSPAATNISFRGSAVYEPTAKGITITTDDVAQAAVEQINNGNFNNGIPDPNGIYVVIFRGDFSWDSDGLTWNTGIGSDFCGFHMTVSLTLSVNSTTTILKVIVVGDPSIAKGNLNYGCVYGPIPTANGNIGADSILVLYARELANTITDYNSDAWFEDPGGFATADFCDFGTGANSNLQVGNKRFLVPQLYIPGIGCSMSLKRNAPTKRPTVASPVGGLN